MRSPPFVVYAKRTRERGSAWLGVDGSMRMWQRTPVWRKELEERDALISSNEYQNTELKSRESYKEKRA